MDGQRPISGPLRSILCRLLCAVAIGIACAPVAAQEATNGAETESPKPTALVVPTQEDVDALAKQVSEDQSLEEAQKQSLTESIQQVLDRLKQISETQQSRDSLAKAAASAADATAAAKAAREQPVPTKEIEVPGGRDIADLRLDELRALKTQADNELEADRKAKVALETRIRDRGVRRSELESDILEATTELKRLESERQVEAAEGEDPRLSRVNRWNQAVSVLLARERLQTLQQEQATYAAEAELLPIQLELADRAVTAQEKVAQDLAQVVAGRRETKVTNALFDFQQKYGGSIDPSVGVLALQDQWLEAIRENNELDRARVTLEREAGDLRKDFEDRKVEVEKDLKSGGELRSSLGLKLQRLRSRLPTLSSIRGEISSVQRKIDSNQVLQSEIESRIEELTGSGFLRGRKTLSARDPSTDDELALLREMQKDIGEYWTNLVDLRAYHENRYRTVDEYRDLIDRNVLWVRSAQPFALADLPAAWSAFLELINPSNLQTLFTSLWNEVKQRPVTWALWAIVVLLLFGLSPRLRRRLTDHGENAQHRGQSKMEPTWSALWLTGVLTLPLVLVFAFPGWRLCGLSDASVYVQAVGCGLWEAAMFILPLELMRRTCRQGGLADAHFDWSESTTRSLRMNLRFLIDIGSPLVFLWSVAENIGHVRVQATLGRLMFALLMGIFATALWSALNPRRGFLHSWIIRHPDGWIDQLRYLWRTLFTAIPVLLGLVCLAGYSYATRTLSMEIYSTIWLVALMATARGLLRRWVLINRRQMLRLQAQQRAAEREKLEETPAAFVEETELDVTQINAQTQRLINAFLVVVGIVGIAWIWASVLPAVEYLERITLIPGEDGEPLLTLANLVLALPIIILTFIASKNLPGLLESVVLQRLPLNNAARYAITTLASYALIVLGIMIGAKTLGLRWESIQWLVAALGVGLGFGLQEIFANFISGLILLFEQPIRVGDIVTLGDTTGVVTRIRIRATTVTNWDRQELIIPNKDLITGRLINWTLSDSTNRIVIKIGVAYGSDTKLACSILEQICKDHPNIADDPGTMVTFEGFGDSTLDLVVRCYMLTLDGRLGTIHDLHNQINDRFAEANLEIAFPQRDLHLRSIPPELIEKVENRAA